MAIDMVTEIKKELDKQVDQFQKALGPSTRGIAVSKVVNLCNALASAVRTFK